MYINITIKRKKIKTVNRLNKKGIYQHAFQQ